MGIIAWIILGLLAGVIAKALLPGDDPGGFIITTLIGVAGAFIGGMRRCYRRSVRDAVQALCSGVDICVADR